MSSSFSLLFVFGCGETTYERDRARTTQRPEENKEPQLKGNVYATIIGKVVYQGKEKPTVRIVKPDKKHQDECPKAIPVEGWYVNEQNKGIQYTLVFLRPPKDTGMPKGPPEAEDCPVDGNGKPIPVQILRSPQCQFSPRVLCLHPRQDLQIANDSRHNIAPLGKGDDEVTSAFSFVLRPGKLFRPLDVGASNKMPLSISSDGCCEWMSAYVWKMTHPYAVVTDGDGAFELKHVPVLEGKDRLTLWVWHEMLPGDRFKEIGPVELEKGKVTTITIKLP
jgi:hypothetical protein